MRDDVCQAHSTCVFRTQIGYDDEMTTRASHGIGRRLAKYRKLAGLSAQQLSDQLGGELSRSVIANIENGRRSDITVDQLIALSHVLGIPPAALALPIDEPLRFVRTTENEDDRHAMRAHTMLSWFLERPTPFRGDNGPIEVDEGKRAAGAIARATIRTLDEYNILQNEYRSVTLKRNAGRIDEEVVEEARASLDACERKLEELGVNMRDFKVDE